MSHPSPSEAPGNAVTANERFANNRYLYPSAGLGKVGQYQMSGVPFLSSSCEVEKLTTTDDILEIAFPAVTRWITVTNDCAGTNAPLRVGFSRNGVAGEIMDVDRNYFVLDNGESMTGEWRVKSIFLGSGGKGTTSSTGTTGSIMAGLTGINPTHLSGNWSASFGVG